MGWLPIRYNDYPLGFLYDLPRRRWLTARLLSVLAAERTTKEMRRYFQRHCAVVYFADLRFGQAIVFRSGGMDGILHGSFLLPTTMPRTEATGSDDGDDKSEADDGEMPPPPPFRHSVEFRCQRFDPTNRDWIYG